jgi:hypothetical protein
VLIVAKPLHVLRRLVESLQSASRPRIGPDEDNKDEKHARNHHVLHDSNSTHALGHEDPFSS